MTSETLNQKSIKLDLRSLPLTLRYGKSFYRYQQLAIAIELGDIQLIEDHCARIYAADTSDISQLINIYEFGKKKYPGEHWSTLTASTFIKAALRHEYHNFMEPGGLDLETGRLHSSHSVGIVIFVFSS